MKNLVVIGTKSAKAGNFLSSLSSLWTSSNSINVGEFLKKIKFFVFWKSFKQIYFKPVWTFICSKISSSVVVWADRNGGGKVKTLYIYCKI